MTDEGSSLGRRSFLRAAGAAGASAALAPLATRGDGTGRARGTSRPGDSAELVVGVSDRSRFAEVEAGLPSGVEILEGDEELLYLRVRLPAREGAYGRLRDQSRIADLPGVKFTESNEPVAFGADPESIDPGLEGAASIEDADDPDDPKNLRQYAPDQVEAPDAWKIVDELDGDGDDAEEVVVAVVDTGIDYEHPDLEDRFGENKGRNLMGPWFMEDDDPAPKTEKEIHGTHVAGIIAATIDNGVGVSGIAGLDGVKLRSYRVLNDTNLGSPTDISQGIKEAANEGADVINMSLGAPTHFFLFDRAIDHAVDEGATPVACTGNMDEYPGPIADYEPKENVWYPGKFDNCLGVSASNNGDGMWDGSKIGEGVDVAAPGEAVYSCLPTDSPYGQYASLSGTSMASPVAAGVAALVVKANPDLEPDEVHQRIRDAADEIDDLTEIEQGSGRVNAFQSVAAGAAVEGGDYDEVFYGALKTAGEYETFSYDPVTEGTPYRIDLELRAWKGTDFDLHVTLDGRDPSPGDYDRADRSRGNEGRIEVTQDDLASDSELGIAVSAYGSSGAFSVAVREYATASDVEAAESGDDDSGSGDGSGESGGEALVDLDLDAAAAPGEQLAFSVGSVEADGVRWEFDDGRVARDPVVTHAFDRPGEHAVELTVERGGDSLTVSDTIEVTPDARAGHLRHSDEFEGRVEDREAFVYHPRTDSPEQVDLAVENPANPADLDLYVTLDGRTPTLEDHDLASTNSGDRQRLVVDTDGPLGVLVNRVGGDDRFRIRTRELGR